MGEDEGLREELRSRIAWTYRVEEAHCGPAGIEHALSVLPDLVLVDVTIPDADGIALLATLRDDGRTRHVPVILLSAGAPHDQAADVLGLAAGVAGLVTDWEPLLSLPASAIGPPLPPQDQSFLERVDDAIRTHMGSPSFGARALAEAVSVSPRQLRRRLAELTGESPAGHVRRIRLERAAALLRDGAMSVKEVSYAVGFASTSGFRAAFREAHGVAPSEFGREVFSS
ncbi:helix-turn-helix transcriptional regulator [Rubrivirga marina]|uniref:helix-turn-helix transcriptional regulator n=1 Tax=Rubrivirga marina TaxID=1196024 RepID=UPI001C530528|nr:helix-turn-helix domain-containing protein [Rubrivirga marina]